MRSTYQRFASRVDDRDQQGRDREPSLGILHVKVPESDDSHLLDDEHTSTADHRLDGQEEESHGKVVTRDNELAVVSGMETASQKGLISSHRNNVSMTDLVDHGHHDTGTTVGDDGQDCRG